MPSSPINLKPFFFLLFKKRPFYNPKATRNTGVNPLLFQKAFSTRSDTEVSAEIMWEEPKLIVGYYGLFYICSVKLEGLEESQN